MNKLIPSFCGALMNRFLTLICLLVLSYVSFAQDLNLGLVAYYKLDGDALDSGTQCFKWYYYKCFPNN